MTRSRMIRRPTLRQYQLGFGQFKEESARAGAVMLGVGAILLFGSCILSLPEWAGTLLVVLACIVQFLGVFVGLFGSHGYGLQMMLEGGGTLRRTSNNLLVVSVTALLVLEWHAYFLRAEVSRGIKDAQAAMEIVANAFANGGPRDMTGVALPPTARQEAEAPDYTIAVAKDGIITITYLKGWERRKHVQIVPVAGGRRIDLSDPANAKAKYEWQCGGAAGDTTVSFYVRNGCRPDVKGYDVRVLLALGTALLIVFGLAYVGASNPPRK